MTRNYKIAEFEMKPMLTTGYEKIILDWVTHGNYAIHRENIKDGYMSIEGHFPREILESYQNAPKPSYRVPFWQGIIPVRGMSLGEYLIEAYATNNGYIKLIRSSCSSHFGLNVPCYHEDMFLNVETLEKIRDAIAGPAKLINFCIGD